MQVHQLNLMYNNMYQCYINFAKNAFKFFQIK